MYHFKPNKPLVLLLISFITIKTIGLSYIWLYISHPFSCINQKKKKKKKHFIQPLIKSNLFLQICHYLSLSELVFYADSCHWSLHWELCFVQQSRTETHDFCNLEMLCELPAVYGGETFVVSSRCKCLQWLEGHLFRGGWIMTEEKAPLYRLRCIGWFYIHCFSGVLMN